MNNKDLSFVSGTAGGSEWNGKLRPISNSQKGRYYRFSHEERLDRQRFLCRCCQFGEEFVNNLEFRSREPLPTNSGELNDLHDMAKKKREKSHTLCVKSCPRKMSRSGGGDGGCTMYLL